MVPYSRQGRKRPGAVPRALLLAGLAALLSLSGGGLAGAADYPFTSDLVPAVEPFPEYRLTLGPCWSYRDPPTIVPLAVKWSNPPAPRPTATIRLIDPNPAMEGEPVTFYGQGSDPEGSVVAYQWRSKVDGHLSNESHFFTASLAPGNHALFFKVRNETGAWSSEVCQNLKVESIVAGEEGAPLATTALGRGLEVVVEGRLAYVAAGEQGLRILDVSDPATPREVGRWVGAGWSRGVALSGERAVVAQGRNGRVSLIDVADPARPKELGAWVGPGPALAVAVSGPVVYVAAGEGGLRIVDISVANAPREVGHFNLSGADKVVVRGDRAYVTTVSALVIIDVADPAQPRELSTYRLGGAGTIYDLAVAVRSTDSGGSEGAAVAGDHAYLAWGSRSSWNWCWHTYSYSGGVKIIDVTEAARPVVVGQIATQGQAYNVEVVDGKAFIGVGVGGLPDEPVFNEPSNKTSIIIPDLPPEQIACPAVIYSHPVYFTGLQVMNVTDPVQPRLVTRYATGRAAIDQAVVGDYLLLASANKELKLLDTRLPPMAIIETVTPLVVAEGEPVTLRGRAEGGQGSGTTYRWRSDISGPLSNATGFTTRNLSATTHTVYFGVQDGRGLWSAEVSVVVKVKPRPTAAITGLSASLSLPGEAVTLQGIGYHPDSQIAAYRWRSSRDGVFGQRANVTTSNLSLGYHAIYFSVKEADGLWSPEMVTALRVHSQPTARILMVLPASAIEGHPVSFIGRGADAEGELRGYLWRSSRDGVIGTSAGFTSSGLSRGNHTITFQVRDSMGAWSEPATRRLYVRPVSDPDDAQVFSSEQQRQLVAVGGATVGFAMLMALVRRMEG